MSRIISRKSIYVASLLFLMTSSSFAVESDIKKEQGSVELAEAVTKLDGVVKNIKNIETKQASVKNRPFTSVKNRPFLASKEALKGQRVFIKKLRHYCKISGTRFSRTHTKDEWENIFSAGDFRREVKKICPNLKRTYCKKKMTDRDWYNLFIFAEEFAVDSDRRPKC